MFSGHLKRKIIFMVFCIFSSVALGNDKNAFAGVIPEGFENHFETKHDIVTINFYGKEINLLSKSAL